MHYALMILTTFMCAVIILIDSNGENMAEMQVSNGWVEVRRVNVRSDK